MERADNSAHLLMILNQFGEPPIGEKKGYP